jgi:hypothetical protein
MVIGRSRAFAASKGWHPAPACPHVAQLIGELHQQDPVLGHHPDQHQHPDLAVDVDRRAGQPHGVDRGADAEGHGQHHHRALVRLSNWAKQHEEYDQKRDDIGHGQRR